MTATLTGLERRLLDAEEIVAGVRIIFDDDTLQIEDGIVEVLRDDGTAVYRWRCTVCGYVHEAPEPPRWCPLCGADREAFVKEEAA